MARRKISEFRAKSILAQALGLPYAGLAIEVGSDWKRELKRYLKDDERYVVKVDQGVKGRFKKGLVRLDRAASAVAGEVAELAGLGFGYVIVEPYRRHEAADERYVALELERGGEMVTWSVRGGVDVEAQAKSVSRAVYGDGVAAEVDEALGVPAGTIRAMHEVFAENYMSFLEINPLVVVDGSLSLLDAAVEVDEEAAPLVAGRWAAADFRGPRRSAAEEAVAQLAAKSQASFRLEVLNPDGEVFLLLSGGGASVVLADEVFNQGYGRMLGNYGEYSGNPTEEETYLYTKQIIGLMLGSTAPRKVLVIGGGVANFTDVRVTFRGVVRALDEFKVEIWRQKIQVFVRRGGPFEVEGLGMMGEFLEREKLLGLVAGPDLMLAEIIPTALATVGGKAVVV